MDCCQRGVKNELVLETDADHIQDKEGFPHDSDPAFRTKKVEVENQGEIEEDQEQVGDNNYVVEVRESNMREIEQEQQNEENNEANVEMNIPGTDTNIEQEDNEGVNQQVDNAPETQENANNYNEQYIEQNQEIQGQEITGQADTNNYEEYLNNYNLEQGTTQEQVVEGEEDYNKYFEQNAGEQNNNADFDINQLLSNNTVTNTNTTTTGLNGAFTFADPQLSLNQNIQGSQQNDYNYNNYNISGTSY